MYSMYNTEKNLFNSEKESNVKKIYNIIKDIFISFITPPPPGNIKEQLKKSSLIESQLTESSLIEILLK